MIEIKKQVRGFLREFTPGPISWQIPVYMADYPNEYRGVGVNPFVFLLEDEIDIAGLTTHEEKALIISHVEAQQSPVYYAGTALAPAAPYNPLTSITEWVIVSDTPFDFTSWEVGVDQAFVEFRIPGVFSDTITPTVEVLNTDSIIFGRIRKYTNSQETPSNYGVMIGEDFFGDAKMTMSDRLYVYRFARFHGSGANFDLFAIPEMQLTIHGQEGELSDLVRIMELRRSYLLQQTIG